MFRDITPVLADGELLTSLVDRMTVDMDALDGEVRNGSYGAV